MKSPLGGGVVAWTLGGSNCLCPSLWGGGMKGVYLQMCLDVVGDLQHDLRMDGFYALPQEGQGQD